MTGFASIIDHFIDHAIDPDRLWAGKYKIPWNDPDFSRRMLAEHLSQEHDLASRRTGVIQEMAQWLHQATLDRRPASILDLGCGPGLYARPLVALGHAYRGLDFGPASIAHARAVNSDLARCSFALTDLTRATRADFGGPYDLASMLFGELNVFPPEDCAAILARARQALVPGGRILLEVHTRQTVVDYGLAPATWYASQGGLFSDRPHVCLTENHWFEQQETSVGVFHVLVKGEPNPRTYHNTMRAWSDEEYRGLLETAGFSGIRFHEKRFPPDGLVFISATC